MILHVHPKLENILAGDYIIVLSSKFILMRSIIIGIICLITVSSPAPNRDITFKNYFDTLSVRQLYDANIVVAEKGRKLYSFSSVLISQ